MTKLQLRFNLSKKANRLDMQGKGSFRKLLLKGIICTFFQI